MKRLGQTPNLQEAHDIRRYVDHREHACATAKRPRARNQTGDARGIDKRDILAIDDDARRTQRDERIDAAAQPRRGGDIDIPRGRQHRYVIPTIHTVMVPRLSTP